MACFVSSLLGPGRQDDSEAGFASHHSVVGGLGLVQGEEFVSGTDAGQGGELHRVFGFDGGAGGPAGDGAAGRRPGWRRKPGAGRRGAARLLASEDKRLYTLIVRFEWDPRKAAANFRAHRISFAEAARRTGPDLRGSGQRRGAEIRDSGP